MVFHALCEEFYLGVVLVVTFADTFNVRLVKLFCLLHPLHELGANLV